MLNVNFKFPPLKYLLQSQPVPERLIMKKSYEYFGSQVDQFVMFSTKEGDNRKASMLCFPQNIYRDGKNSVPSLYVWKLFAPGGGFGTAMLDFARTYSKKLGCNGNIHLQASGCYDAYRVPHIFYRKYGMNTNNPAINSKLDQFITKGKSATCFDFDEVQMFYPPVQVMLPKENKFLKALKTFFSI